MGGTPTLSLRLAQHPPIGWCSATSADVGLDRCRVAFTGRADLAGLIRWYLALGIDIREVYGQTENCGVAKR